MKTYWNRGITTYYAIPKEGNTSSVIDTPTKKTYLLTLLLSTGLLFVDNHTYTNKPQEPIPTKIKVNSNHKTRNITDLITNNWNTNNIDTLKIIGENK